jgi:predicted restriction endonuclease
VKLIKNKCEVCGERNKSVLDAHHVIPKNDKRSTDKLDNLICVCSNCHRRIHRGEVILEGRYSTSVGSRWFWHNSGEPPIIREGIHILPDGTADIRG